jgi:hypothetical protein
MKKLEPSSPVVPKQTVIGEHARAELERKDLFASLTRRELSPRRVERDRLAEHGLQRFVRVEKPEQALPASGPILRTADALRKLEQAAKAQKSASSEQPSTPVREYRNALHLAANPSQDMNEAENSMARHAVNSDGSPFLSGTPAYSKGVEGQDAYVCTHQERGVPTTITISHTDRAVVNRFNTQELELLLPVAEHAREVAGTYTIQPNGDSTYVDTSSDSPKTFNNEEAKALFAERAGSAKVDAATVFDMDL